MYLSQDLIGNNSVLYHKAFINQPVLQTVRTVMDSNLLKALNL